MAAAEEGMVVLARLQVRESRPAACNLFASGIT
jgi:hypothetical protein